MIFSNLSIYTFFKFPFIQKTSHVSFSALRDSPRWKRRDKNIKRNVLKNSFDQISIFIERNICINTRNPFQINSNRMNKKVTIFHSVERNNKLNNSSLRIAVEYLRECKRSRQSNIHVPLFHCWKGNRNSGRKI